MFEKIAIVVLSNISVVVAAIVIGLIVSYPLMLLWNYCLVSAVSIVHEVSWMQMWGLLILFSAMFKTSTITTK